MPFDVYATFLLACLLLFLKPGPAMSVIVANSVEYRVSGGLVTVAGNALGFGLLMLIVALGLAWIATVMQQYFTYIRMGGALYLIWLGVSRLRAAGRVTDYGENPTGELFRDGFIVAVANPEVILFLAAFLPPFVDTSRPVAPQLVLLGASFMALSTAVGVALAFAAGQARRFLSGDRLKHIDYASGVLIIIAGMWLIWPRG